jgi:hypothetical protein
MVHHEATFYRRVVAKAVGLAKGQRDKLTRMVNLWFKHRGDGLIRMGNAVLMDKLGVTRNTFRTFVRWAQDMGFLSCIVGGSGRGDTNAWAVNLGAIQEAYAPNAAMVSGDQRVTIEGEIDDDLRGSIFAAPYIKNSKRVVFKRRTLSKAERFWIGYRRQTGMVVALIHRLQANRRGEPVGSAKHCPAKPTKFHGFNVF